MELDLGEIRKNIDAIDDQLLELFKQRMGLTRKVAEYKAAHSREVRINIGRNRIAQDSTSPAAGNILPKSQMYLSLVTNRTAQAPHRQTAASIPPTNAP